MTLHVLKCWTDFYEPIATGAKTFDLRRDDRRYRVGDTLHFHEWDTDKGKFTGRSVKKLVVYKMEGVGPGGIAPYHGLSNGYCIMGLADLPNAAPSVAA